MHKRILYAICLIAGYCFIMVSLIFSFVFKTIEFIALGSSATNALNYLFEYPLNIVITLNIVIFIIGLIGLLKDKEKL